MTDIFHLAIPTHDLDEAERFYTEILGARRARRYDDRVTFEFFGHQIVCHLAPDRVEREASMYPRHFGITLSDGAAFARYHQTLRANGCTFWKDLFIRFGDRSERHRTFFVTDPSNNLIEFKHYDDPAFVY